MEHVAEIAANEEERKKEIAAKERQMAAMEKKFRKEQANATKAHGKEVAALNKDLEGSANIIHFVFSEQC